MEITIQSPMKWVLWMSNLGEDWPYYNVKGANKINLRVIKWIWGLILSEMWYIVHTCSHFENTSQSSYLPWKVSSGSVSNFVTREMELGWFVE